MKNVKLLFLFAFLSLSGVASQMYGYRYCWYWDRWDYILGTFVNGEYNYLTDNNGAHAVGMTEYDNGKIWVSILAERWKPQEEEDDVRQVRIFEYKNINLYTREYERSDSWPLSLNVNDTTFNGQVSINSHHRLWTVTDSSGENYKTPPKTLSYSAEIPYPDDWRVTADRLQYGHDCEDYDRMAANAVFQSYNGDDNDSMYVVATCRDWDDPEHNLQGRLSTNNGGDWRYDRIDITPDRTSQQEMHPSLATNAEAGTNVYLVYEDHADGDDIIFRKSTDCGRSWPDDLKLTLTEDGTQPCVVAINYFVFVCWTGSDGFIKYRYSLGGGAPGTWAVTRNVPLPTHLGWTYDRPNAAAATCGANPSYPGVLIVARLRVGQVDWNVRGTFLKFHNGVYSFGQPPLSALTVSGASDEPLNPSVAAMPYTHWPYLPQAFYVVTYPYYGPFSCRLVCNRGARYGAWPTYIARSGANTARLLAPDDGGTQHYAEATPPYYMAGTVIEDWPVYGTAGMGGAPALAVDGACQRWVAFQWNDSLFCHIGGELAPRLVFAGSSSAVPGQPSIACYPNQAYGVYVGALAFTVYDTADGTCVTYFARVDTGQVVLDTIASSASLGDSFPCISVYRSDTLVVTWQHGDSVLSSMLENYGPGATSRPGPWSTPTVIADTGFHPMSLLEGDILNCVWTEQPDEDSFAICRATNDLSGESQFQGWADAADPLEPGTDTADGGVYAGCGVSVWQEKVSGDWVIRACARGETLTLVTDTVDVYHPHSFAESSAITPSIDQLRIHCLYTAGVTFEVDSGVYDTGEARYMCESLNVSRAGSDATRANNGAKLLRKAGSDSLACVYADLDGAIAYAVSANGDTWSRSVLVQGRDWPAIAEDSSGRRWVVMHQDNKGLVGEKQEMTYRFGPVWSVPATIYQASLQDELGPAAVAGASATKAALAYAAFRLDNTETEYILVAKFDGSTLDVDTIGSGVDFGDPSLAVEPVSEDSNRVHVVWEDDGEISYRMTTDDPDTATLSSWTSVINLSNTEAASTYPFIAADPEQVVVAWAESNPLDILCRKRSTDSACNVWESTVNLSRSGRTRSAFPVIAMGDTVIVAWEERLTETDCDIMASINFDATLNVADNSTWSSYPHVVFQNKTSGDTTIPYVHTIWSETPQTAYYEVRYDKCNLKQAGGGQQSASQTPIPRKPALNACRPNPFRDRTTISYQLPQAGNTTLRIYDVAGRTVKTLVAGFQKPGQYSTVWDGRDSKGRTVAKGIYFYRLDTPGFRDVKKAVVVR